MDVLIWAIIGYVIGVCFEKLFRFIFRRFTFTGYLVLVKNKTTNETESIYADLNVKPDEIKPQRWIWMRTQELYLKEDDK